jgi:hypothetical protein
MARSIVYTINRYTDAGSVQKLLKKYEATVVHDPRQKQAVSVVLRRHGEQYIAHGRTLCGAYNKAARKMARGPVNATPRPGGPGNG